MARTLDISGAAIRKDLRWPPRGPADERTNPDEPRRPNLRADRARTEQWPLRPIPPLGSQAARPIVLLSRFSPADWRSHAQLACASPPPICEFAVKFPSDNNSLVPANLPGSSPSHSRGFVTPHNTHTHSLPPVTTRGSARKRKREREIEREGGRKGRRGSKLS